MHGRGWLIQGNAGHWGARREPRVPDDSAHKDKQVVPVSAPPAMVTDRKDPVALHRNYIPTESTCQPQTLVIGLDILRLRSYTLALGVIHGSLGWKTRSPCNDRPSTEQS